jgi:hypothetical protein
MAARRRDARLHATTLLGRWTRLAQGHLPLGVGCSCGAPAVNIRVADLERDVLDYLYSKHPRAPKAASLPELLRQFAQGGVEPFTLLTDLERSLDSFENLHR